MEFLDVTLSAERPSRSGYEEDEILTEDELEYGTRLQSATKRQFAVEMSRDATTQSILVAADMTSSVFVQSLLALDANASNDVGCIRCVETRAVKGCIGVCPAIGQVVVYLLEECAPDDANALADALVSSFSNETEWTILTALRRVSSATMHLDSDAQVPYLRSLVTSAASFPGKNATLLEIPNMLSFLDAALLSRLEMLRKKAIVLGSLMPQAGDGPDVLVESINAFGRHLCIPDNDQLQKEIYKRIRGSFSPNILFV